MDPDGAWNDLLPWQKRAALPVLDMARHMMDAFPRSGNPLEMPGVVLLDRPETFCTKGRFSDYMTLLDTLFPRIQFILSAGNTSVKTLSPSFWKIRLPLPEREKPQAAPSPHRLSRDTVLLIDVVDDAVLVGQPNRIESLQITNQFLVGSGIDCDLVQPYRQGR